jgi:peptidoglycan/LPS O-acetylase OafA/YrhL
MKGVGCVAIVLHHLAFYGPMANVVAQAAPDTIAWLFDYARLAVQMFFVLAGYLVAARVAPDAKPAELKPLQLVWGRYKRLVTPFIFAVASATLITALVRPWFEHDSLSAAPSLWQLVAHGLLIHDVLGYEALSAGVWYVAIDFQLFVATVLITLLMRSMPARLLALFPLVVIALAASSLWILNRHTELDIYAPYFFGAYGLGVLAYWSNRSALGEVAIFVILALGGMALWIDFRYPIAVALGSAMLVSLAAHRGWLESWPKPGLLTALGQRSYSIFLIHYGICVGVNAVWHRYFPEGVLINTIGMLIATLASISAGASLYRFVESRAKVFGRNGLTLLLAIVLGAALLIESLSW